MDKIDHTLIYLAIGLILVVGIWMILQWEECRAEEFSVFYCIQHIL